MMKQFHVVFKDGSQDWIDPVLNFEETDEYYIINNGYYDYTIDKEVISTWEFLEIPE